MDETLESSPPTYRSEGFPGQRLGVVPRPQLEAAAGRAVTRRLTVTDAGYFPEAKGHRRSRPHGATEAIVILCTAGTGRARFAGAEHVLAPGSCIVIPAGEPHEYWASDESPWTIWWMHVRGTDAPELVGAMRREAQPVLRLRSVDRVVALFDELVTELERRPSPSRALAASGIAWHVLTRVAADAAEPADGSPLERAIRYLEVRVDGSIRVSELAAMVGLSPSHLTALFRRATGGGPGAFRTALRMTRARALLDTTALPVAEVAAAVGYVDPLYFSRQFSRVHGLSPSAYRAQHKG